MGVKFKDIVNFEEIQKISLKEKVIAIDAYTWLYQFLAIIRQYDGALLTDSKDRVTSHLSGIFYRNLDLLKNDIKPIWVFDGKPPYFKKEETNKRIEQKILAIKKYEIALEQKDYKKAKIYAQRTSRLTKEMIESSKKLLHAMGISTVDALSEGEAQAAQLVIEEKAYAVGGQDYDTLIFGSQRLVRNLSASKTKKLNPQLATLSNVLNSLGIDRKQLILLAMLIGTDYNNGVNGIGPKKGLSLVKKHVTLEDLKKELNWNEKFLNEIYDFFLNPQVTKNIKIIPQEFNKEKVLKIMIQDYEFSQKRITQNVTDYLMNKKINSQSTLNSFI